LPGRTGRDSRCRHAGFPEKNATQISHRKKTGEDNSTTVQAKKEEEKEEEKKAFAS